MSVLSDQNKRLCELVPSKGRRNELRAFAYSILERGDSIDTAILMSMREKQISLPVAREIVAWVAANSFNLREGIVRN
jgi:hypothetical protein